MNATIDETTDEQRNALNGQPVVPEPDSQDPELIRADIMATRTQLGDTVEALAARMDVRSRMVGRAKRVGDLARRQWIPLSMIATAVVLVGVGIAIRRRGSQQHRRREAWRDRRDAWQSMRHEQLAAWRAMRAEGRERMRAAGRKLRR